MYGRWEPMRLNIHKKCVLLSSTQGKRKTNLVEFLQKTSKNNILGIELK